MEPVGKHGIQLQPGLVELFLPLFADDLVLLSSTAMGLQNQLNHLTSMCKEHSLSINTEKSKVMVFRKGGFLGKNEKWFLEGNEVEVVNSHTYFGYTFTAKLSVCQLKVKKQHMTVSKFCVILVKWQDRSFSKCLMRKSNQSFCIVQKYGAFSVLMWLRKSTHLFVNGFWMSHQRLQTNVCMGILEGTPCLSVCVYKLLNTGLNCYTWPRTGCQNKPTTCKSTQNWMASDVTEGFVV